MKLVLSLLLCIPLWANDCTLALGANNPKNLSATGGLWTGVGCTGASYIPGVGDTIADITGTGTSSLTVNTNWEFGTSPIAGTDVFKYSVPLVINGGITFWGLGGVVSNNAKVTFGAGSIIQLDPAAASDRTSVYTWHPSNYYQANSYFISLGTSGSHVTLRSPKSAPTDGQWRIDLATFLGGNGWYGSSTSTPAQYTDFMNIGDATHAAIYADLRVAGGASIFMLDHCTFTGGGGVWVSWHDTAGVFSVTNLAFSGTLAPYTLFTNTGGFAIGAGTRLLSRNSFDMQVGYLGSNCTSTGGQLKDFTITNNYFGGDLCTSGTQLWATASNNFVRLPSTAHQGMFLTVGPSAGFYVFADATGWDNPHFAGAIVVANNTLSGSMFESPDNVTSDSGEVWATGSNSATPITLSLVNCILIPSKTGISTAEMSSVVSGLTNITWNYNHNTWIGGVPNSIAGGFGMFQVENGIAVTGNVSSTKSNLAWGAASGTKPFYKWATQSNPTSPTADVVSPANADYNNGWNTSATNTACTHCTPTSGVNSYIGNFSSTPGTNDMAINPNFVDQWRNVALWDTKYLGNIAATAWVASTSYSVGNIVSVTNAGVYNSLPVNYVCIVAHTSGASTKPDSGASWRTDWQYQSLVDISAATIATNTYTDGAIDCVSCTVQQALIKWVQKGYVPTTPSLWCAGHDSETVGAVPFCAKGKALIAASMQ